MNATPSTCLREEAPSPRPSTGPASSTIPREVAHSLNPLIGVFNARETMASAANLISALGYVVSDLEDVGALHSHFFELSNTIAAALPYETEMAVH